MYNLTINTPTGPQILRANLTLHDAEDYEITTRRLLRALDADPAVVTITHTDDLPNTTTAPALHATTEAIEGDLAGYLSMLLTLTENKAWHYPTETADATTGTRLVMAR